MSDDNDPWAPALCAPRDGLPPTRVHVDKWFPAHYYQGSALTLEAEAAISICNRCPIQDMCATFALEHHIDFGIWGGTTPQDRGRRTRKRFVTKSKRDAA